MSAPRVFESLQSASSVLDISVETLRAAKDAGCPNFHQGNRIHEKGLKKWIGENAEKLKPMDEESLKARKTIQEIRKLQLLNDAKEATLVPRAIVLRAISNFAQAIGPILDQQLINELPPQVAGMDVAGTRVVCKRICDRLKLAIQGFEKEFEI